MRRIREYAEQRIHCFRPLTSDDVVWESDAQKKEPTGDGTDHPSPRTPVGSGLQRFRRSGMSCDNCGAEEDQACQPFCRSEQVS
jgi:hypothetical protein